MSPFYFVENMCLFKLFFVNNYFMTISDFTGPEVDFGAIKQKLLKINYKSKQNKIHYEIIELYKSLKFNNLVLKNHFIFSNLNDEMFYGDDCLPNNLFDKFYLKIASSQVGLIVTGGVFCCGKRSGLNSSNIDVDTKKALLKHKNTITKIHSNGTKIFLQIKPIFGRHDNENRLLNIFNYSPSNNFSITNPYIPCARLSDSKCDEIVNNFYKIALFSKKSGYDGIVINGDLFNILGEFSSFEFNRRTFGYYSDKMELSKRILKKINAKKNKINIIYTITIFSFLYELFGSDVYKIKTLKKINISNKYNSIYEFLSNLVNLGVDGFIFKFGTFENEFMHNFNAFEDEHIFFDIYKEIKSFFDSHNIKNKYGNDILIIYYDNFSSLHNLDLYCQNKHFDLIDVTKNLYADLNYLIKYKNNLPINQCLKCNYCNYMVNKNNVLECMINPTLIYDESLVSDKNKNIRVAIVGGGISGIVCANYLLEKGYSVDIYEKNDCLNKNGKLFEIYGFDKYLLNFNKYIENALIFNKNKANLRLFLNTEFKTNANSLDYNIIIVASGFREKLLNVDGSVLKSVKKLTDILNNKTLIKVKENIIIYARTEISLKFALYLLISGVKLTIILADLKNYYENTSNDNLYYYLYQFNNFNTSVYFDAEIHQIHQDFAEIIINRKQNGRNYLSDSYNKYSLKNSKDKKIIMIDCDMFIYEPELYSNNKLYYELINYGYSGELFMIGSALQISNLASDVKSAYFVAKNL